ncbi:hypothetical protein [Jhaorihella thermophila]|uniref:HEAT repeat domain-containing protein n=1 Tax=Jhaorihella thermophila TaxID=488547 RepID=A0A1H5XFL5_9RHOB|nr:hypothetical protein [Jhaorihella thermophila]SEG10558.1 hypothetical protein SAMN05421751_1113 [Jhaorihella thermophila]
MTKLAVRILVALLFPTFAAAAGLKVQSGEHDGFTRLVLPLPSGAVWDVTEKHRSVEIRILSNDAKFDTSQVFRKISKDRISGIRELEQSGGLILDLACTCTVSSFVESGNYLVVDIKDQTSRPPQPSFYRVLPQNTPAYRFLASREGPAPEDSESHAPKHPSPEYARSEISRNSREGSTIESILTELGLAKVWRRNLRQHIEAGAAVGLLSRSSAENARNRTRPPAPKDNPIHSANMQASKTHLELEPFNTAGTHLSVKSARQTDIAPFEQAEKTRCGGAHLVDIASWGAPEDFSAQIGSRLPALFSQSGEISKSAAIDLARIFLFWGLGEEAARIVERLPDDDSIVEAILAIAELLQDTNARGDYFAGQTNCNSVSAMWATIATVNKDSKINTKAVLQAFSKLPVHLREVLGSTIATRLKDGGEETAAGVVARMLKHAPDKGVIPAPHARFLGTESTELFDHAGLEGNERTNALSAASAVMELIEQNRHSARPVSRELVDLVSSFVVEFRGSTLEPELLRTQAVALSLAGDFPAAMRVVGLDQPTVKKLNNFTDAQLQVLTLLVQRADDIDFLQHALPLTSLQVAALPASLRHSMADRLASLGLDGEARKLAVAEPPDENSDPRDVAQEDYADPRRAPPPAQEQKGSYGSVTQAGREFGAGNPESSYSPTGGADRLQPAPTDFDRQNGVSEFGQLPPLAHARRLLRQSALLRENLRAITGDVAENW